MVEKFQSKFDLLKLVLNVIRDQIHAELNREGEYMDSFSNDSIEKIAAQFMGKALYKIMIKRLRDAIMRGDVSLLIDISKATPLERTPDGGNRLKFLSDYFLNYIGEGPYDMESLATVMLELQECDLRRDSRYTLELFIQEA